MSEQGNRQEGIAGDSDHEQHRAGPNEGVRAPLSRDSGGPSQTSIFDGKGNESVVVATTNKDGRAVQGSGADVESALKEAKAGQEHPGSAFGNPAKD